jgi:hypothetical protein
MKLPVIKHCSLSKKTTEITSLKQSKFRGNDWNCITKDEELDVIGELISNMYGALEVNKLVKTGPTKETLNSFMKRVLGSIDQ